MLLVLLKYKKACEGHSDDTAEGECEGDDADCDRPLMIPKPNTREFADTIHEKWLPHCHEAARYDRDPKLIGIPEEGIVTAPLPQNGQYRCYFEPYHHSIPLCLT